MLEGLGKLTRRVFHNEGKEVDASMLVLPGQETLVSLNTVELAARITQHSEEILRIQTQATTLEGATSDRLAECNNGEQVGNAFIDVATSAKTIRDEAHEASSRLLAEPDINALLEIGAELNLNDLQRIEIQRQFGGNELEYKAEAVQSLAGTLAARHDAEYMRKIRTGNPVPTLPTRDFTAEAITLLDGLWGTFTPRDAEIVQESADPQLVAHNEEAPVDAAHNASRQGPEGTKPPEAERATAEGAVLVDVDGPEAADSASRGGEDAYTPTVDDAARRSLKLGALILGVGAEALEPTITRLYFLQYQAALATAEQESPTRPRQDSYTSIAHPVLARLAEERARVVNADTVLDLYLLLEKNLRNLRAIDPEMRNQIADRFLVQTQTLTQQRQTRLDSIEAEGAQKQDAELVQEVIQTREELALLQFLATQITAYIQPRADVDAILVAVRERIGRVTEAEKEDKTSTPEESIKVDSSLFLDLDEAEQLPQDEIQAMLDSIVLHPENGDALVGVDHADMDIEFQNPEKFPIDGKPQIVVAKQEPSSIQVGDTDMHIITGITDRRDLLYLEFRDVSGRKLSVRGAPGIVNLTEQQSTGVVRVPRDDSKPELFSYEACLYPEGVQNLPDRSLVVVYRLTLYPPKPEVQTVNDAAGETHGGSQVVDDVADTGVDLGDVHESVINQYGPDHGADPDDEGGSPPEPPPTNDAIEDDHLAQEIIELNHPGFERLEPRHTYTVKAHEGSLIEEQKEEGIQVGENNVSWGIYQIDSKDAPHMWVLDVGAGGQAADFSLNMDGNRNECEHGDFAVVAVAQPNGVEPDRRWTIQAELLRRTPALTESVQHPPETLFVPTEISIGESATIVITNWPRNDGAVHTNHHESHMIHIQGTKMNIILDNFDANCLVNVEGARGQPIAIQKEDETLITGGENHHPLGLHIITKEQGAIRVRIDDITYHSHQEQPTTSFTLNIAQSQDTEEQLQPAGGLVRVIHEGDLESPVIQQYHDNAVSGLNERFDLIKDEPIGGRDGVLMTVWPSAGHNRKEIAIPGENKIEFGFDDYKGFEGSYPQSTLPRLWIYQEGALSEALSMQMTVDKVISGDFGNYKIIAIAAPSGENQYNLTAAVYPLSTAEAASRLVAIQTLESRAHDAELNEQTGSALQLYTEAIDSYVELERKGMLDRKGTHRIVELYKRIGVLGDKLGATPLTEHKRVLLTPELHVVTGPPFEPQEYSIQHEGGEIRFGVDNIKEGFDGINPDNPLPRVWVYQQGVTQQAISFQPTQSGDQYPRRLFGDCSIIALPEHLEDDTWKVTIALFRQPEEAVVSDDGIILRKMREDLANSPLPPALHSPLVNIYRLAYLELQGQVNAVQQIAGWAERAHIPFVSNTASGFAELIQAIFTLRDLKTGEVSRESISRSMEHLESWLLDNVQAGLDLAQLAGGNIGVLKMLEGLNADIMSDGSKRRLLLEEVIPLIAQRLVDQSTTGSQTLINGCAGAVGHLLQAIQSGDTERFGGMVQRIADKWQPASKQR